MNARAQCAVLTLLGTLGVTLVASGSYTRYVHTWMRVPLLVTSLLLVALAVRIALRVVRTPHGDEPATASAWLLVVPVVAVGAISPPALGAYAAERSVTPIADQSGYPALPETGSPRAMRVSEFAGRAQWGPSLADHEVRLTGFVSGTPGHWYLTRLAITCCAADALAYKVEVTGAQAPPRDTWVAVTGSWVDPGKTALPRIDPPELVASSLERVAAPAQTYE